MELVARDPNPIPLVTMVKKPGLMNLFKLCASFSWGEKLGGWWIKREYTWIKSKTLTIRMSGGSMAVTKLRGFPKKPMVPKNQTKEVPTNPRQSKTPGILRNKK